MGQLHYPQDYQVEADFFLLTTCNYRCDYCFIPPQYLGAKVQVHATPAQWAEAFDASGRTWLLHLTGGEPLAYPGFAELCRALTQRHRLSINTNLSLPAVRAFAAEVDPVAVHYVHASLHPEERGQNPLPQRFLEHTQVLQRANFTLLVSVVMTPAVIAGYPELRARMAAEGIALIPKILRTPYRGQRYPASYSEAQKALIREWLHESTQAHAPVLMGMGEAPTLDMHSDARFLDGIPSYRGRDCGAGYNFVRIQPDGALLRCNAPYSLGHVLRHEFHLFDAPRPCDTQYCPYFCEKFTGPAFARERATSPRASSA